MSCQVIHLFSAFSPIGVLRVVVGHTLSICVPQTSIFCNFFSHIVFQSFISSLMSSSHLLLSPLLLFPCTCIVIIFLVAASPSFPNKWPYHLSRLFVKKVVIDDSMLDTLRMSSFLAWSFFGLPLAHLSIPISVVCSFWVSLS